MAIIRWCPIYPKWDSYQPLQEDDESIEVANLQQQLAAAAARCKDSALLKKAMDQLLSWATAPRAPIRGHV